MIQLAAMAAGSGRVNLRGLGIFFVAPAASVELVRVLVKEARTSTVLPEPVTTLALLDSIRSPQIWQSSVLGCRRHVRMSYVCHLEMSA
jgi:hypothetical protein